MRVFYPVFVQPRNLAGLLIRRANSHASSLSPIHISIKCGRQFRQNVVVAASINPEQNHYAVLGLRKNATSADIKQAYRLLARKYHPDVNKESRGDEVFKSIHHAYEVLSNEVTRAQYDRVLQIEKENGWKYRSKKKYNISFDDDIGIHQWAEYRRKMQRKRDWDYNNINDDTSFYSERNETSQGVVNKERGSFIEVLRSAFISLFLSQIFGCRLSLTFSSFTALLDRKLDAGYKIGYVIAWFLGGRGGILLTLCLLFASWMCGKSSSSMVALVVVAMWTGSYLARYAPLPQGAILTLIYMSLKLQRDTK